MFSFLYYCHCFMQFVSGFTKLSFHLHIEIFVRSPFGWLIVLSLIFFVHLLSVASYITLFNCMIIYHPNTTVLSSVFLAM